MSRDSKKKLLDVPFANMGWFHHTQIHQDPVKGGTLRARQRTISEIAKVVRRAIKELDVPGPVGLVGAGVSGALIVPSVADKMGLPFALLRSRGARSAVGIEHGDKDVVGLLAPKLIFVDDLIDGGNTFQRVETALPNRVIGIVLHLNQFRYKLSNTLYDRAPDHEEWCPTAERLYKSRPVWFVGI